MKRQQEQYEGQMGENTDTSGASQGFYDSNMQGEHIVLSGLFNGTKKNLQSANFGKVRLWIVPSVEWK